MSSGYVVKIMPELPEVESVRCFLEAQLMGAEITALSAPSPVVIRSPQVEAMTQGVVGLTLCGVGRRGKYLLLSLASDPRESISLLVLHLKMQGVLRVEAGEVPAAPALCAVLTFADGRQLRYHDLWRWGGWWLLRPQESLEAIPGLRDLGEEPLSSQFTPKRLAALLKGKRGKIKPFLLDQRQIAGIGNIYADESLHRAGLHPERSAGSLSDAETLRLYGAIVEVLNKAVTQGGAYARQKARNGHAFDDFSGVYTPRVYGRSGDACPVCRELLTKFQLQGRGTTYCPHCQPSASAPTEASSEKSARTERSVSAYV